MPRSNALRSAPAASAAVADEIEVVVDPMEEDVFDDDEGNKPMEEDEEGEGASRRWTAKEDAVLTRQVEIHGPKNWKAVSHALDRTPLQCLHRWNMVLDPSVVKGPWSKEEDTELVKLVNKLGPRKWSTLAEHLDVSCPYCLRFPLFWLYVRVNDLSPMQRDVPKHLTLTLCATGRTGPNGEAVPGAVVHQPGPGDQEGPVDSRGGACRH